MKNIHKNFTGVKALQAVDFSLREGEIHALMGENGAGKSTLIKVLTGVYEKDEGEIFLKVNFHFFSLQNRLIFVFITHIAPFEKSSK